MAFKSFKHKIGYAKNFNRSAAATSNNNGSSTQFFDNSYPHYLRDNQHNNQPLNFFNNQYNQNSNNDTYTNFNSNNNDSQNNKQFAPYTVLGANSNFNLDFDTTNFIINHLNQPQTNQFANSNENGNNNFHNNALHNDYNSSQHNNLQIDNSSFNYTNYNSYYYGTNYQNTYIPTDYLNNNPYYNLGNNNNTLSNNNNINNTGRYYSTLQQTKENGNYIIDNRDPWDEDLDNELNKDTYLKTHIDKINESFEKGQFNMINSLYQSLKRNNIVPPIQTFEKIFISFNNRSFDNNNQNLNDKMWQLLNCYQDMINNKLKPTIKIYNILLLQIFKNSIIAFETNNLNGFDFFKIGSELVHTINKNNNLSNETINYYLLAMNIFNKYSIDNKLINSGNGGSNDNQSSNDTYGFMVPDLVQLKKEVIDLLPSYTKDSFYFISLVRLASLKKDVTFIKQMYKDFLLELSKTDKNNISLRNNQFEIYSIFISSFIESGDENIADKIFNNILLELQKQPETTKRQKDINLVISNYLISISKNNCQKAYDMWSSFNKLPWVSDFSYEFYLLLMSNSFHDWSLTKKIYDYIFPMERLFKTKDFSNFRLNPKNNLSSYLLYPVSIENVINSLMDYALQLRDNDIIAKLLEESIVKNFAFSQSLYPFIFNYLKNIDVPHDYLLKFINSQGSLFPQLSFIDSIVQFFKDDKILNEIVQLKFFNKICANVSFAKENVNNLGGLNMLMDSIWKVPMSVDKYPLYLKLYGVLITRLNDFDTLSPTLNTNEKDILSQLNDDNVDANNDQDFDLIFYVKFKNKIIERFIELVKNCKELNINTNSLDPVIPQAVKLVNLSEKYINFFTHPGDWDKSYPLSLVSKIKKNPESAFKEFERLYNQGYCFDYSTYKELIVNQFITPTILKKVLQFPNDINEIVSLKNMMIEKLNTEQIQIILLDDLDFFKKNFIPSLKESSLLKILDCLKTSPSFKFNSIHFINLLEFPYNYRTISKQIEFKRVIEYIYKLLFEEQRYESIINFNDQCRVINLEILLKSYIKSGNKKKFNEVFKKYSKSLTQAQITDIEKEFQIENRRIQQLIQAVDKTSLKKNDKKLIEYEDSFKFFIRSFSTREVNSKNAPKSLTQFINKLSSFHTMESLIPFFESNFKNLPELNSNANYRLRNQFKLGISTQLLENILKASNIFVNYSKINDKLPIQSFRSKINLYYNLKTYLKNNIIVTDDLLLLIKIWSNILPKDINKLLNNIIETIYLEDSKIEVGILHLPKRLKWNFNKNTLNVVLNEIQLHCKTINDIDNLNRIDTLKQQFAMD